MVHFKYLEYFPSNELHIDTFYVIYKTFFNFPGFTGNDVIIPEKLVIFAGTSTQIICIGPRNNCANFHVFSTMSICFSPFSSTIQAAVVFDTTVATADVKHCQLPVDWGQTLPRNEKRDELMCQTNSNGYKGVYVVGLTKASFPTCPSLAFGQKGSRTLLYLY